MVRKRTVAHVDEELLRSAEILAARKEGGMDEVFEEALRRYLKESGAEPAGGKALSEVLFGGRSRRLPGVPREEAVRLPEGETLSEAVIAERESRAY